MRPDCKGRMGYGKKTKKNREAYFFPFTRNPCVKSAFCSLAWLNYSRTSASVTEILSDVSCAFKSAIYFSLLDPHSTGHRALDKEIQNLMRKGNEMEECTTDLAHILKAMLSEVTTSVKVIVSILQ